MNHTPHVAARDHLMLHLTEVAASDQAGRALTERGIAA
jgi:hypothetical protein